MKRTTALLVFAVAFLAAITLSAHAEQKRLALVIGNGDYLHVPQLRNPANDAEAMSAKLKALGFTVITVVNGTYRQMMSAESRFADELTRYDVGLFYYSGHGVQYRGTNYLVPVDADIRRAVDIQFEAVNANRVIADMGSAGTNVNIIILDACRNDPFQSQFRSLQRGLSVVQAPTGSLVVYSTAPDQVASDGQGKDSPFTAALLKNIADPGEDVQVMLTNVFREVQRATHGEQVPWSSSSLTSTFYFESAAPAVASAPAAATQRPAPAAAAPAAVTPAPSGPAVAVAPGSASSPIALTKGALKIDFKLVPPPLMAGWVHIELTGPFGAGAEKPLTVSKTVSGQEPVLLSLEPGTYNVRAKFSEDVEYPYQHETLISPGSSVTLNVPLDYSQKFKTEGKISDLKANRDYQSTRLATLQHQRVAKTGWGSFFTVAGVVSSAASGVLAILANSAYNSYQSATTSTDATTYRNQVEGDRTGFLATAIGGGLSLIIGVAVLATRPSVTEINSDQQSLEALDAQLAALRAQEGLEK